MSCDEVARVKWTDYYYGISSKHLGAKEHCWVVNFAIYSVCPTPGDFVAKALYYLGLSNAFDVRPRMVQFNDPHHNANFVSNSNFFLKKGCKTQGCIFVYVYHNNGKVHSY